MPARSRCEESPDLNVGSATLSYQEFISSVEPSRHPGEISKPESPCLPSDLPIMGNSKQSCEVNLVGNLGKADTEYASSMKLTEKLATLKSPI